MSKTKKPADIEDILTNEIRAALGTNPQKPLSIWFISSEMAAHLDVSSIEFLTTDPGLLVELHYPASGGIIVAIYFAKCGTAELEAVIEEAAASSHLPLLALT